MGYGKLTFLGLWSRDLCILQACLVAHIFPHKSQVIPPCLICLDSMWFETVDLSLDWNSQSAHWKELIPNLIILDSIIESRSE